LTLNQAVCEVHATVRMAQRSIDLKDAELIALIGTEVEDGFFVRAKDYLKVETQLKKLLKRSARLIGKRLIVANGRIITAYHASRSHQRRLLRNAHECDLY
jgi:hypothetical protein